MAIGLTSARRRRVLSEDVKAAPTAGNARGSGDSETAHEGPRYEVGAAPENQPQCTDFIPRRYRSLLGCFCLGATLISGILSLGVFAGPWAAALGPGSLDALAVAGTGTLASWFSSITLSLVGALAVLIYSLRRHRIDDYRGRYRVWLWAAAGALVLSIDAVAPVHEIWVALMSHLTGWTALSGGAAWWLIAVGVALVLFGARVLVDLVESRLALTCALMAIASCSTAVATHLGWIAWSSDATTRLVVTGTTLSGHLLMLVTLLAYARHVILDSQGLLPVKAVRESRKKARDPSERKSPSKSRNDASEKPSRRQRKVGASTNEPEVRSTKARKGGKAEAANSSTTAWVDGRDGADDDYDDENGGRRKLSKSARKRLRKQKARQQR